MTTMELQSTNILITSIGSMSGEYAISSLRRANFGKLYGCDLYPSTYLPHSRQLDGFFQVPRGDSETYEEAVAKIVKKYNINLFLVFIYRPFQELIISIKYIILILVDAEGIYEHFTNCRITKRKKTKSIN